MDWIKEYAMPMSAVGTIGLLAIWTFYFMLFYNQYAEYRRPKLLVHITNSLLDRAELLLVNLGQEALHIEAVIAVLVLRNGEMTALVTDFHGSDPQTPQAVREAILKQGPLKSTDFISIGPATDLMQRITNGNASDQEAEEMLLEVRIVAFGHGRKPIGARRQFLIQTQGDVSTIFPKCVYTEQFSSRRRRDIALEWLQGAAKANVVHAQAAQISGQV